MIKNKYQRLNKKERKDARLKYYETELGKVNKGRFTRLLWFGILSFIYSGVLILDTIINKHSPWNYSLAGVMFIFGLIFIIGRKKIIIRNVNEYLIKKSKK